MQIVIEIPEEVYESVRDDNRMFAYAVEDYIPEVEWAIKNGTPLPKGHGKLIDADKLPYEDIECTDGRTYMVVNAYDVDNAPTIIEADEEEKDV